MAKLRFNISIINGSDSYQKGDLIDDTKLPSELEIFVRDGSISQIANQEFNKKITEQKKEVN